MRVGQCRPGLASRRQFALTLRSQRAGRLVTALADVAAALNVAHAALGRAHDAAALWSDTVRQTAERRLGVGGDDTAAVLTDAEYGRALDVLDAIEATTAAHAAAVRHLQDSPGHQSSA